MREVRVTGDFNDPLLTDIGGLGEDSATATARGVLRPEGDDNWPARTSTDWQDLQVADNGDGSITVSWLLTQAQQTAGHCWWWLHLQAGALNLVLRVRDPEDPEHPWHIWVH